jgi:hypothetical protein
MTTTSYDNIIKMTRQLVFCQRSFACIAHRQNTKASANSIQQKKLVDALGLSEQLRLLESLAEIVRQRVELSKQHSILELEGLGAGALLPRRILSVRS